MLAADGVRAISSVRRVWIPEGSTNRVKAEINIYPHNGSITGYANASYRTQGGTASFSGTMSIIRGTGTYNHAHGTGLKFSGTINRSNDAVKVRLSGPMAV